MDNNDNIKVFIAALVLFHSPSSNCYLIPGQVLRIVSPSKLCTKLFFQYQGFQPFYHQQYKSIHNHDHSRVRVRTIFLARGIHNWDRESDSVLEPVLLGIHNGPGIWFQLVRIRIPWQYIRCFPISMQHLWLFLNSGCVIYCCSMPAGCFTADA